MSRFLPLTIYNLAAPLVFTAMLPGALRKARRRGGYDGRFGERLGRYPKELLRRLEGRARPFLVQAVSVGEAGVAAKLVRELHQREPDIPIVLATTTPTGQAIAEKAVGEIADVIYSPLDLPPVVLSMLDHINPRRIVLVDSDLWPNLLWLSRGRGIPTSVVNARLSPRSEGRFRKLSQLTRPIFSLLDQVCVETAEDAQRWAGLGVDEDRIVCTGSIKFDTAKPPEAPLSFGKILTTLWPGNRRVLLGASTHPGEEILLAQTWKTLLPKYPDLRLAITPRHAERGNELEAELRESGFEVSLRSEEAFPASDDDQTPPILLINTTGELAAWQSLADVVVIGKSLEGIGGQNPAEAVAAGTPVVTGPHMENFEGLMNRLREQNGIVEASSTESLVECLDALLRDPEDAKAMAQRAQVTLEKHRGATMRTAEILIEKVDS